MTPIMSAVPFMSTTLSEALHHRSETCMQRLSYVAGYIKIELIDGETNFSDEYGGFSHLFLNEGGNWWTARKTF